MNIKTTLNIRQSLFATISTVASQYNVTKSFIINTLVRKAIKYNSHKNRFLQRVHYQKQLSDSSDTWHRMAVSFFPDVYEKCLDVRKLSKISVSFFVSCAFEKFFEELIEELECRKESDNYTANYIVLYTNFGYFNQIITIWDMIEPEKLAKLKKIHTD